MGLSRISDDRIRTVACIHDLSCVGRCALSVVMPTLSVMGYQAIPIPTALLSTHTGGFEGFTFRDLSDELDGMCSHWASLGLRFDSIYSGFLGSDAQVGFVERLIRDFRADTSLVLVDPVLGDDGALYRTITDGLCCGMRTLVSMADVITPNMTEACVLLGIPPERYSEAFDEGMLERLSALGPRRVVITGIHIGDFVGTASYDRDEGIPRLCMRPRIHCSYPGTGDIFSSVLLGKMLGGASLSAAAEAASNFVGRVIGDSMRSGVESRYGVKLESHLAELIPIK